MFKVLNRALDHLEEWLIATLIAAATALIFAAVLHRYGTGVSIDLAVGYSKANTSPILKLFLSRIEELTARKSSKARRMSGPGSAAAPR